jgi:hypothetical protein
VDDSVAHVPRDPGIPGPVSGFFLWVGEVFIGLTPLLVYLVARRFTAAQTHVARCPGDMAGEPHDCHWATNGIEAEICILTLVLSGLALLSLVRPRAGVGGAGRHFFRIVCAFGLAIIAVFAAMLYAWIITGNAYKVDGTVWWLLSGSVLGSFFLAMERAFKSGTVISMRVSKE